jgi:transposase
VLSEKQRELISLLAKGMTNAEAIRQSGIGEKTLYRWLKLEEFKAALSEAKGEAIEKVLENASDDIEARIKNLLPLALATLEEVLQNPDRRVQDKLRLEPLILLVSGVESPHHNNRKKAKLPPMDCKIF